MFEYLRSSEFLQKGGLYSDNIRYVIAKKKVDELFSKWLSMESTTDLFHKLLRDALASKPMEISSPSPLFNTNRLSLQNSALSAGLKSPSTPPKASWDATQARKNLSMDGSGLLGISSLRSFSEVLKDGGGLLNIL